MTTREDLLSAGIDVKDSEGWSRGDYSKVVKDVVEVDGEEYELTTMEHVPEM